jgi:hypothetical protein
MPTEIYAECEGGCGRKVKQIVHPSFQGICPHCRKEINAYRRDKNKKLITGHGRGVVAEENYNAPRKAILPVVRNYYEAKIFLNGGRA